jgi:acyl-CoA reductase-like NAD-dependent aldehyde dehydrogenase
MVHRLVGLEVLLAPQVGFGGLKQSGIGTESGLTGLLEFTEPQTLTVKRSA